MPFRFTFVCKEALPKFAVVAERAVVVVDYLKRYDMYPFPSLFAALKIIGRAMNSGLVNGN